MVNWTAASDDAPVHALALALQLTAAVSSASTTLDAATIRAATLEAARIWQPHVQVTFTRASDSLVEPDVVVVITDGTFPVAEGEVSGIGQIRFVSPGRPMNTIYLSVSGARRLAAGAKWKGLSLEQTPARVRSAFLAHALGRALAHEMGHFLLKSTAHTPHGLMRARYLTTELADDSLRPYSLTSAQAADIRRERSVVASGR